jgi:hypothetical protein
MRLVVSIVCSGSTRNPTCDTQYPQPIHTNNELIPAGKAFQVAFTTTAPQVAGWTFRNEEDHWVAQCPACSTLEHNQDGR